MVQIERHNYFMAIAAVVSARSTCLRAHVGAVLVSGNRILATGYNGSPRGFPHCHPDTCGPHIDHCRATVHAEINAIIAAAATGVSTTDAILYTTHTPCEDCARALVNARIREVRIWHMYGKNNGVYVLEFAGIQIFKCSPQQIFNAEFMATFKQEE